jgi:hypothetical protein
MVFRDMDKPEDISDMVIPSGFLRKTSAIREMYWWELSIGENINYVIINT